jgi:hypothetical protein
MAGNVSEAIKFVRAESTERVTEILVKVCVDGFGS